MLSTRFKEQNNFNNIDDFKSNMNIRCDADSIYKINSIINHNITATVNIKLYNSCNSEPLDKSYCLTRRYDTCDTSEFGCWEISPDEDCSNQWSFIPVTIE